MLDGTRSYEYRCDLQPFDSWLHLMWTSSNSSLGSGHSSLKLHISVLDKLPKSFVVLKWAIQTVLQVQSPNLTLFVLLILQLCIIILVITQWKHIRTKRFDSYLEIKVFLCGVCVICLGSSQSLKPACLDWQETRNVPSVWVRLQQTSTATSGWDDEWMENRLNSFCW